MKILANRDLGYCCCLEYGISSWFCAAGIMQEAGSSVAESALAQRLLQQLLAASDHGLPARIMLLP